MVQLTPGHIYTFEERAPTLKVAVLKNFFSLYVTRFTTVLMKLLLSKYVPPSASYIPQSRLGYGISPMFIVEALN